MMDASLDFQMPFEALWGDSALKSWNWVYDAIGNNNGSSGAKDVGIIPSHLGQADTEVGPTQKPKGQTPLPRSCVGGQPGSQSDCMPVKDQLWKAPTAQRHDDPIPVQSHPFCG
jgi:hypothetical protein